VTSTAPLIGGGAGVVVSSSDQAILDSVTAALSSDASLNGAVIRVLVSNGVVSLSGTAQSGDQADRAREVAESAAGSARVNSAIKVG
jgi:osmotically-inducible protein OsmY